MSSFLIVRTLRDLADGPVIAYSLQQKYEDLNFCRGNASVYNTLHSLCLDGYAHSEKIGNRKQYFISPKGLEVLEYFQFNRDIK